MPAEDWGPPFDLPATAVYVLTIEHGGGLYDEPVENIVGTFQAYRRKLQSRELVAAGKDASTIGYLLLADFDTGADLAREYTDLRFEGMSGKEERWNVISVVPVELEQMYMINVERVTSDA